ncbi:hypothetical protein F441_11623 [Phytophthora nicotianae CJ01A1]|uniref:Uncharacterized protein n=2 Tax=Phytophthora nicotianae TaxID=4792 RepID=W2IRP8_PHYNI|nr:hypothetical protein L915_11378 [Phytophthora nicotianae]ETL36810.1 hypothetical protein L916_11283 [Phytophthora nicotianae]ETP13129.1 hypothetical protein F441_11623 [Phytophthora nicotianae CJ01A1]
MEYRWWRGPPHGHRKAKVSSCTLLCFVVRSHRKDGHDRVACFRSWSCAAAAVSVVVSDASSFEPVQQWCFIANVALLVSLCLVQNYYTESFNVVFEIHDSSSYEHFQRHGSTFWAYK